jgi:hypothetical protein
VTPAEPGWEVQAAEFSAAGLLHDTEPSSDDYDADPSREDYDADSFDERRRHLRLVREQARRRSNGRRLLVSAGIALLGVFCLGLVTLHVLIAENQFTLDRLTQTAATEQASYEKLRLQVAQLEAPARIVSDSEGHLGLVQPGSVTYLPATNPRVTNGSGTAEVGTAQAGTAQAGTAQAGPGPAGPGPAGSGSAGPVTAPQGDADWPSIKPYLSGSP